MKTINFTHKTLYRLGGAAVLAGGVLGALAQAIHPADPQGPADMVQYARAGQPVHLLLYVAIMLVLLGLPVVYARQSHKAGLSGFIGFLLVFIGLPLTDLLHSVIDFMLLPTIVARVPDDVMPIVMFAEEDPYFAITTALAAPILLLGAILLAVSTLRARVLSPWPAWVLLGAVAAIVAILFSDVSFPGADPTVVVFYLALGGFGGVLLVEKTNQEISTIRTPTLNVSLGSQGDK